MMLAEERQMSQAEILLYCPDCDEWYPPSQFRRAHKRSTARHRALHRGICRRCEITRRTDRKKRNRLLEKARRVTLSHSPKLRVPAQILRSKYGWEPTRIAHEFEHAWKNGCPICGELYQSNPGGLSDMTVDVIDRAAEPHWG